MTTDSFRVTEAESSDVRIIWLWALEPLLLCKLIVLYHFWKRQVFTRFVCRKIFCSMKTLKFRELLYWSLTFQKIWTFVTFCITLNKSLGSNLDQILNTDHYEITLCLLHYQSLWKRNICTNKTHLIGNLLNSFP